MHKDYASKLFGWPDLVQRDVGQEFSARHAPSPNLLIQIGEYHDGRDWGHWEPGGSLYFVLSEKDIAPGRFDRAELEVQCT